MSLNRFQENHSVKVTETYELIFLDVSQQNWPPAQAITAAYNLYRIKWLAINVGTDYSE